MGLKFVLGRAGTGKTTCIIEKFANDIKKLPINIHKFCIVPEQASFSYEKEISTKFGGAIGGEVISFERLFYRLCSDMCEGKKYIDNTGKVMLLTNILHENQEKLQLFSSLSRRQGFAAMLADLISELERFNVDTRAIQDSIINLDSRSLMAIKLNDIAIIYDAILAKMGEDYIDDVMNLKILAEKIRISGDFKNAKIYIDGFKDFNGVQLEVIEAFLLAGADVEIALTMPFEYQKRQNLPNEDLFYPIWNTCKSIENIAKKAGIMPDILVWQPKNLRYLEAENLANLEKILANEVISTPAEINDEISIFSANNMENEVKKVTLMIKNHLNNGYRLNEIAVVARNIADYEDLIGKFFNRYELPYFYDSSVQIYTEELAELVLSALEIKEESWSMSAFLRYLKTNLVEPDKISFYDISRLENYILQYGITKKDLFAEENWQHLLRSRQARDLQEEQLYFDYIRRTAVEKMAIFSIKTAGKRNVGEYVSAMKDLLRDLDCEQILFKQAEALEVAGEVLAAKVKSQIFAKVINVLDQLQNFMAEQKITIEDMSDLVLAGLKEEKIELTPATIDEIIVGDVERSRLVGIKVLFVLGVNEGVFPAKIADSGLFGIEERKELAKKGITLSANQIQKQFEEEFLIYKTLTQPKEKLILSYSSENIEANELKPSLLIRKIAQNFPESVLNIYTEDEPLDIDKIAGKNGYLHDLAMSLVKSRENEAILGDFELNMYNFYCKNKDFAPKIRSINRGISYLPQSEKLPLDLTEKLYKKLTKSSVSRLETFNSCPALYFSRYGLRLQPREIFQFRPMDIGNIYHQILEEVLPQFLQSDEANLQNLVQQSLDEQKTSLAGVLFDSSGRNSYIEDRIINISCEVISNIKNQLELGSYKPILYEAEFGENGVIAGKTFELADGTKVTLEGKIDRVDRGEGENKYLRVIDYKSGQKNLNFNEIIAGTSLQLPTYLSTVLNNENGTLPGGMFYSVVQELELNAASYEEAIEMPSANSKNKLRGLGIHELDNIYATENEYLSGWMQTMSIGHGKNGFYSNSVGITIDEFKTLEKYVDLTIKTTLENMRQGEVNLKPCIKNNASTCDYCDFTSICSLEKDVAGLEIFKQVAMETRKNILQKMKEEVAEIGKLDK